MERRKGSISIFGALSLMLIAAVLFTLLEGARYSEMKKLAGMNTISVTESVFAGYIKPLWEEYHLLAFETDGQGEERFGNIERGIEALSNENLAPLSGRRVSVGHNLLQLRAVEAKVYEYRLITDAGAFEAATAAFMKNHMLPETAKFLYSQYEGVQGILNGKPDASLEVSEEELLELEMKENPITVFEELKEQGILFLTVPDSREVSKKQIMLSDSVSKRALSVGNYAEAAESAWTDKLLMELYINEYFGCFTGEGQNRALSYEQEYVIGGAASDTENLKIVVRELLAIRTAANLLFLCSNSAKKAEAAAAAIALAGEAGHPAVIEAVKWAVLGAWAYVEALLDVRTLLSGEKISMIKNSSEWTSDVTGLASSILQEGKAKNCVSGMDYRGYLGILLLMKGEDKLAYRAMDAMEATVQKSGTGAPFYLDCAVLEAKIKIDYGYHTIFLGMEALTKGKSKEFFWSDAISYSYRRAGA